MLRAKSPFKKRSPKLGSNDPLLTSGQPSLHHYSSVQEFQQFQKQQQLLNGNAWAQRKGRSRTNSQHSVEQPDVSLSAIPNATQSLKPPEHPSLDAMDVKTPKTKRTAPPPLRLVPDSAPNAEPIQRDSLETRKHALMQMHINVATNDAAEEVTFKLGTSAGASAAAHSGPEHIARPKSPGKKLFHKFFRHHTSSETPPKISPEWNETPEKAVKVLGKESLRRKKEDNMIIKRRSEEERLLDDLDFRCAGDSVRSRSNTLASDAAFTPSTAEFDVPTDREIRSVGGVGRHAVRVPTLAVQRAVSDTAALNVVPAVVDGKLDGAGEDRHHQRQHKHLQYLNNAIPPTPPSKEQATRPSTPELASTWVQPALKHDPDTPSTAFCVFSDSHEKPKPFSSHLARYGGHPYLNLVLNKPSGSSLRGAPSIRSAYGFVISPSAELANGSTFASPGSHFIESPVIPRSGGLSRSRNASLESQLNVAGKSPYGQALGRRWSDTSIAAWKAQSERAVPCLPPAFYSPCGYVAPDGHGSFTRPSANVDPSLYYLPHAATGDLDSFASRACSQAKSTSPSSINSSECIGKPLHRAGLDRSTTTVPKPQKFLVKKRCSSNIAAAARKDAASGLGLSGITTGNMHKTSESAVSEDGSFFGGPPSAMPPPLNVFRRASMESLPAKEELDAFLALHLHVDGSTNGLHQLIARKFDQTNQANAAKHDELLKELSAKFSGLLVKVDGIDEQHMKLHGTLDIFKADVNEKIIELANIIQEKVLDAMSKMVESNAKLDQSITYLTARIVELEKSQKDLVGEVTSKGMQKSEPNIAAPPTQADPTPIPATTTGSPTHSFPSQGFAVSYPPSYSNGLATSNGGPVYSYVPYVDPFTSHPSSYVTPHAWNGQVIDAGFAKLPREQRVQHMQTRYGGNMHAPRHPAFRSHERNSGTGSGGDRDGANGA